MSVSLTSIRVVHVDDEPGFAELVSKHLTRQDDTFEVHTATGPAAGLDLLETFDVDCVVSDYDMPNRNGIEFLADVRADYPELPFILYTGKGSEEVASEAISAGITDYLQKQPGSDQYTVLANRIRNAVESYRSRQELRERNRRLETLISNLPGVIYRCQPDPPWNMQFVEGECEELTGYSATELESDAIVWGDDILHPDHRSSTDAIEQSIETGEPFEVSYRIIDAAGETKWVWERGRAIRDENGHVEALEGFITDVTDRESRR